MAGASILFRLGSGIGKGLKGFSTWLSGVKVANVFKSGLFVGTAGSLYLWWNNSVNTVAEAVGATPEQVMVVIYIILGIAVFYLVYKMLEWKYDRGGRRR